MNTSYVSDENESELNEFHRSLAGFNCRRLTPTCGSATWRVDIANEHYWRLREGEFVARERETIATVAAEAPSDADGFAAWFEALQENGPGQKHAWFPWLAKEAPREAMIWFLRQEVAGEAGFEDLVAMTQVKLPTQAKLELARNYWDEMGQGHVGGMHGPMLEVLARELEIESAMPVLWQSLALGNLMTALATNRRYAFHSVGALGVIELTAPWRASHINEGLKRLGVGGQARRYFALHATLDVKHSIAWNREVLRSLVAQDPATARVIAEGALMRLEAGRRCFDRYSAEQNRGAIAAAHRSHPQLRWTSGEMARAG